MALYPHAGLYPHPGLYPGGSSVGSDVYTRPVFSAFTEAWYALLPARYRAADEVGGWPLLRFMATLGEQADEIRSIADRIDYLPVDEGGAPGATSDLVDVDRADEAWLPYMAQARGVVVPATGSVDDVRDAIRGAVSGRFAGTRLAIIAAARSALTGTRFAEIIPNAATFTITIRTLPTETPSTDAVIAAVVSKRAKPAGVMLVVEAYAATWAQTQAAYPTWASVNGKTFREIRETGHP